MLKNLLKNKFNTNSLNDLFSIIISGFIALYFLIGFPMYLLIERDLELNGLISIATVAQEGTQNTKSGIYRTVKAEYIVNNKSYKHWFSDNNLKIGDKTKILYSPLFPSYSRSYKNKEISWNTNILFRLFIFYFFGLFSAIICYNSYKKYCLKTNL
jgi:hypothetical protein